jgi:hypothetical protein
MPAYPSLAITLAPTEGPPAYDVLSTPFEAGYRQTRLRNTVAPRTYGFSHEVVPAADAITWVTFWNSQKGASTTFDFTDPRTGAVVVCRFHPDRMNGKSIEDLVHKLGNSGYYTIGPIYLEEAL